MSYGPKVRSFFVYIAGPYTTPDPIENTRDAITYAVLLRERGYVPIVPHLTMLWHFVSPKPIEYWYAYDIDVMSRCDAVLRIPGESTGADLEVQAAHELDIPVVYSTSQLDELRDASTP